MRTIHFAGFTLAALLSVSNVFGADPRLLNLVMPDARMVAGANVLTASTTPFGQYILAHMNSVMDRQLSQFVKATGFDPRHDVTEFVAASGAKTADEKASPAAILAALGNFPVDQITAAAAKVPSLKVQNYGGATLIAASSKNEMAIAFLGTNIAAAGDLASVKAAIDRSAGANSLDPSLATRIQALSTTDDAWAISLDSVSALIFPSLGGFGQGNSPESQIAQMLGGIQSSSGGVKFGANVEISGQAIASDAKNAKALADVAQALASIFSMGASQNPEAASLAQLLQSLKVTADGTAINLALSIPEAQLETILKGLASDSPKVMMKPALMRQ